MNKKALVLAGIFLAVVLAFPIYALTTTTADEKDVGNSGASLADESELQEDINTMTAQHNTLLTIMLLVDAVFMALFLVALYIGIKP